MKHWRNGRHRPSDAVTRTARWKRLRLDALRRDGWQCVQCGRRTGLEVDHIKPVRDRPDLGYSLDNLQTLCKRHHIAKTRLEIGLPPVNAERYKWLDLF